MRLFWCAVLLLTWAAVSHGQAIRTPLTVNGDCFDVSVPGFNVQHVWGHAVLQSDTLTVWADDVTANRLTGNVVAFGHLRLTQGPRRIIGERLTYNLNTQCGTLVQAMVWEEGAIIRGDQMEVSPQQVVAHHAIFTTCPNPAPHYAIFAERITFFEAKAQPGQLPTGGHVALHHGTVWFHGRRRFALPDYTFAVGDLQRRQAALIPSAGSGSGDGPYVSVLHHFGAVNGREGADMNLRLTQRRGLRGFLELYRTVPAGNLYLDYMRRQNLGDLEPAANQIIGSTAAVLIDRQPELGAARRAAASQQRTHIHRRSRRGPLHGTQFRRGQSIGHRQPRGHRAR